MAKNVVDKATIVHVRTLGADADNVTGRGDVEAGTKAQSHVVVTGAVSERVIADGRIRVARGVATERLLANGCVPGADGVVKERVITVTRV